MSRWGKTTRIAVALAVVVGLGTTTGGVAVAATIGTESGGDFPNNAGPSFNAALGDNVVSGTLEDSSKGNADRIDDFTVVIPAGAQVQFVTLTGVATVRLRNCANDNQVLTGGGVLYPTSVWTNCNLNVTVTESLDPGFTTNWSVNVNLGPVDNVPPSISVTGATVSTPAESATAVVNYTYTASDAGSGVSTVVCTPPPGSAFPIGTTTVTCVATDVAGNSASASASIVVVDDVPPVISAAPVSAGTDAGAATAAVGFSPTASDNSGSVSVTCVPPSGSTFPLGATSVACTATDGSGNSATTSFTVTVVDDEAPVWTVPAAFAVPIGTPVTYAASATDNVGVTAQSCTPASPATLPAGTHTVQCTASDAAGNVGSASFDVTVGESVEPVWNLPADISTTTDSGQPTAVVNYVATASDDVAVSSSSCTPASGSAFGIGTTTVSCTATDTSGNVGLGSFTITVTDDEPPVWHGPADLSGDESEVAALQATVTGWFATDNDSVATSACVAAGSWTVGETDITCDAEDASGNRTTVTITVTISPVFVDTVAPVIEVPADITAPTDHDSSGAVVTYVVTALDETDGAVAVDCTPSSGSAFPVGPTTVTCTASDVAGNDAVASFTVTVVDTQAPAVTGPLSMFVETDEGEPTAIVSYPVTAVDAVDGPVAVSCTPTSGSALPIGTTNVSCSAVDAAGNTATIGFPVYVVDLEAPTLSAPATVEVDAPASSSTASVSFVVTATDNSGTVDVTCRIGSTVVDPTDFVAPLGLTEVTCTALDPSGQSATTTIAVVVYDVDAPELTTPSSLEVDTDPGASTAIVTYSVSASDAGGIQSLVCSPPSGSTFPLGTTTVTCEATDTTGNTASASFDVTVVDGESPVIVVPANMTVATAPGLSTALVTFVSTATDNVGVGDPTCDPASGSTFPLGTTTVTCEATDAAGNSASASFTVTVVDGEDPFWSLPADIATTTDPGSSTATVTYIATVEDNGTIVNSSCAPASGSEFGVGTTTVVCTALDDSGNESVATFHVVVVDDESPVWTVPSDIETATATDGPTATVHFAASAVDNVAIASASCSPASGSAFAAGTTTVQCEASDDAGNTSTASFTVTVLDEESPTWAIPADFEVTADPGATNAVVVYSAEATDNVGVTDASCSPSSGSAFPIGITTVTCTAHDDAGNSAVAWFTVTVTDDEAPIWEAPSDDVNRIVTDPAATGAVVTFDASAADNDVVALSDCVPASGSVFPFGSTTVTCTATDASGNTAQTSFAVVVVDGAGPIIDLPAMDDIPNDPTMPSAAVTYVVTTADHGSAATVECAPASGSIFPVGSTTVRCLASDATGNETTASFTVVVVDTEAPSWQLPSHVRVVESRDAVPEALTEVSSGSPVTFVATATDNVAILDQSCSPSSGSLFAVGDTVVTCVAIDAAGNRTQAEFLVTVEALPATETTTTTTTPATPSTTAPAALPTTGGGATRSLVATAVMLIGVGGVLTGARRRRVA